MCQGRSCLEFHPFSKASLFFFFYAGPQEESNQEVCIYIKEGQCFCWRRREKVKASGSSSSSKLIMFENFFVLICILLLLIVILLICGVSNLSWWLNNGYRKMLCFPIISDQFVYESLWTKNSCSLSSPPLTTVLFPLQLFALLNLKSLETHAIGYPSTS